MNALCVRVASCALFLLCLPAAAQNVRYEQSGQAYVMDLVQSRVEYSMLRTVLGVPPSDRGQVVFYRPARVAGSGQRGAAGNRRRTCLQDTWARPSALC